MENWKRLNVLNNYVHIMSPSMAMNNKEILKSFHSRRALFQDLIKLEEDLKEEGLTGWFSWTLFLRPHVMRLFSKLGARPYMTQTFKDPSKDTIWFIKEV